MTALNILFTVILAIAALYFFIILLILAGVFRLKRFTRPGINPMTKITVIIPVRNEEETISTCLTDLYRQDYPLEQISVVVVNDASTDRTEEIVKEFAYSHPDFHLQLIRTLPVENDRAFKKHSICSGIEASSGELVVTTDADTRSGPGWISTLAGFYEQFHPKMIIGPVAFHEEGSFFERLQSLEFAGLIAATAGSCSMGFPLMCNGANLAFNRNAYEETRDSRDGFRYPSGDDLFLMMKILKKYRKQSVRFLFSEEAIILTKAKKTPAEFFSQRLRWVSKSRGYTDRVVSAVAIVTYLFNLLLLATLITGIFNIHILLLFLILFGIKIFLELPAVYKILVLFRKTRLLFLYPLTQVIDLVYVSAIGLLGNLIPYKWKGRRVSPLMRNNPEKPLQT